MEQRLTIKFCFWNEAKNKVLLSWWNVRNFFDQEKLQDLNIKTSVWQQKWVFDHENCWQFFLLWNAIDSGHWLDLILDWTHGLDYGLMIRTNGEIHNNYFPRNIAALLYTWVVSWHQVTWDLVWRVSEHAWATFGFSHTRYESWADEINFSQDQLSWDHFLVI